MKTLYIHGLDSHPVPEKLEILRKNGFEVFALHLDYRTHKNPYKVLKDYAIENEVELLIGSSLGGFFAFWIGEDLGLKSILFNPALAHRILQEIKPPKTEKSSLIRLCIFGENDEQLNPEENKKYLLENTKPETKQRIITCEWLKHQIDYESFEAAIVWSKFYIRE